MHPFPGEIAEMSFSQPVRLAPVGRFALPPMVAEGFLLKLLRTQAPNTEARLLLVRTTESTSKVTAFGHLTLAGQSRQQHPLLAQNVITFLVACWAARVSRGPYQM